MGENRNKVFSHNKLLITMRSIVFIVAFISTITLNAEIVGSGIDKAFGLLYSGNAEDAIGILKRGASTNDVFSQYYIAFCYENGIVVEKDVQTAFRYFRRAAERGFSPAMYQLARFYKNGIGVAKNESKGDEWTNRALKRQQFDNLPDIVSAYVGGQYNNQSVPEKNERFVENDISVDDLKSISVVLHTKQDGIFAADKSRGSVPVVSDVDTDIPYNSNMKADNIFALIIANENYQEVANVENAINDGEVLSKYLERMFGLPEKHIHFIKDATYNNIKRELNYLRKVSEAYKGDASFIIYYAGHGIPDENTRDAFLLPIDGFSSDMSTCIRLDEIYTILNTFDSKKVVVIFDACFSGAARDDNMLYSARGVKIKPKSMKPRGNCVVFSSTQGDETAYSYPDQSHGLFTYFLLRKLKESQGDVTFGELFDYIQDNVIRHSLVINGKSQTPSVQPSIDVEENWRDWKFN